MIVLLLMLSAFILFCFIQHQKQKAKHVHIHKRLLKIEHAFNQHKNVAKLLASYNALMKARINKRHSKENVTALYGEEWLNFLDKTGKTLQFSQGSGRHLGFYYQNTSLRDLNLPALSACVRHWLRQVEND